MGLIKNYHNSINIWTNLPVLYPFSTKLQGWRNPIDAFNFNDDFEKNLFDNQRWILDYKDNPDTFHVNSDFFRSDEFRNFHKGKHILFSGCSVTYGMGLYTEELWSYKLYKKIEEKERLSGYFNLGTPGTSIIDVVFNIFKYISKYGNPDVIFVDLPDLSRFYVLHDKDSDNEKWDLRKGQSVPHHFQYYHATCKEENLPNLILEELKIYYYQYMMMLEIYCIVNNIKLYLFSYSEECYNFLNRTDLSRVFRYDKELEEKFVFEYCENNKDDYFALIARDNAHQGTAYHKFWSEFMFDQYARENYEQ